MLRFATIVEFGELPTFLPFRQIISKAFPEIDTDYFPNAVA